MKRLRVFLATAAFASAFVVGSAGPAGASCAGDPVDPCAVACAIGYDNKHTHALFKWCEVT